jgi:hypothetical protein
MEIINKISGNKIVYVTEDGERKYSVNDIIKLAKGNIKYAELLIERANGYGIETIIDEDLREGEIVEFNNQYILTDGIEIEIITK